MQYKQLYGEMNSHTGDNVLYLNKYVNINYDNVVKNIVLETVLSFTLSWSKAMDCLVFYH